MRLGVVLEAFLDRTFDDTLALVAARAPQVTDVEVGVGGFAPHPHCDVELLLHDRHCVAGELYTVAATEPSAC